MNKRMVSRGSIALALMTMVPIFSSVQAYAATTFDSQYQANASQETSLLSTAQSSGVSDSYTTTLANVVQNLNNQVAALYTVEQNLAGQQSSVDQLAQPTQSTVSTLVQQLEQLLQQRQQLLQQTQSAWAEVNRWFHGPKDAHAKDMFDKAHQSWQQLSKDLDDTNRQISALKKFQGSDSHGPQPNQSKSFDSGLSSLQNSILQLQQAAIQYTQNWITEEQNNGSTSTTQSLSTPSITVSANNGVYSSINVTNVLPGATVTLYNSSTGQAVYTATASSYSTASFSNVAAGSYYVVQSLNGMTSAHSSVVSVNGIGQTPSIYGGQSGGLSEIVVNNGVPNTTVYLYNASTNQVYQTTATDSSGNATFRSVPAGTYYVRVYQNGQQSPQSNQVTVNNELTTPSIAESYNGQYNITVSGGVPGANITLYTSNGNAVTSANLDSQGQATFSNVGSGSYYVIENYSSTNSQQSNVVTIG
jgi:Carboxypeptidase regulatory-like domain/Prealbumin-like fold domain